MAVFKVTSDFKTVINPDAAKLVPELKLVSENELIFCILAIDDVDGPFRKKPASERMLMAKKRYPDIKEESQMMLTAMAGYKGLLFDRRKHTIEVLERRYRVLDVELETDLTMTPNKMAGVLKMQEMLSKRIEGLQSEIDSDEMAYEIRGAKKLSFIEKWQLNQKEWAKFNSEL